MSLLAHNNPRTMAPPGRLPESKDLPTVVVASVMRSGTHLVIDSILNNFRDYRNTPLYIDLDEWVRSGNSLSELKSLEGVVIKTHYPQVKLPVDREEMQSLLAKARVITPVRDLEKIWKSSTSDSFSAYDSREEFDQDIEQFQVFWKGLNRLDIDFKELVGADFSSQIDRVAERLGVPRDTVCIAPFAKSKRLKVYFYKFLTRIIGKHSPIINTTIGFAKK